MPGKVISTTQGVAWDQLSLSAYGAETLLHRIVAENMDDCDIVLFSGDEAVALPHGEQPATLRGVALPPPWER